jgi:hypothetical protein
MAKTQVISKKVVGKKETAPKKQSVKKIVVKKETKNVPIKKKIVKKETKKDTTEKNPKVQFSLIESSLNVLLADCNSDDEKSIQNLIFEALLNGHSDNIIAKIYSILSKDRFKYDCKSKIWYLINEFNIWKKEEDGSLVKQDILEKVSVSVNDSYNLLKDFIDECTKKKKCELEICQTFLKRITKNKVRIIKYLGSNTNKNSCLGELKGLCDRGNIASKFDNINRYIIGFNNGIYDLKNYKFRLPKPSEMVSMSVGYDYLDDDKIETKLSKANKILKKVLTAYFEKQEDHDTVITEIAACLDADPSLEQFYYHSGGGSNGKGVIAQLIRDTFGDYQKPIKIGYITKSKNETDPNKPDPTMAELPNIRIGLLLEAKSEMTIENDIVKRITGRDPQVCRQLQGINFSFIPVVRLFIQSNYDINIEDASGYDIKRRFKARNFPYTFCQNPDPKNKKEKQGNDGLKKELSKDIYKLAFFKYLLKYYKIFVSNGRKIKESDNCKKETNRLLNINDPVGSFLDEYTLKTNNYSDVIQVTKLVEIFKKLNQEHPLANTIAIRKMTPILEKRNHRVAKNNFLYCHNISFNKEKLDASLKALEEDMIDGKEQMIEDVEFNDELENDGNYKLELSGDEEEIPVVKSKKHSKKSIKIESSDDESEHISSKKQIKPIKKIIEEYDESSEEDSEEELSDIEEFESSDDDDSDDNSGSDSD